MIYVDANGTSAEMPQREKEATAVYIERLLQDHQKLRALSSNLIALVGSDHCCNLTELARCRWELARMVHQHLAYEEQQLFSRTSADPRAEVRLAGEMTKRRIEHLHQGYKAHIERWTNGQVVSRWPEFQRAVGTLVTRMKASMDREEQVLFPMLPREPITQRRWEPGTRNWAGVAIALEPLIRPTCFQSAAAGSESDVEGEKRA